MPSRFEYSWTQPTRRGASRILSALRSIDLIAAIDDPISEVFESLAAECDETRTCVVFRACCNRVLSERERDLLIDALLYTIVEDVESV